MGGTDITTLWQTFNVCVCVCILYGVRFYFEKKYNSTFIWSNCNTIHNITRCFQVYEITYTALHQSLYISIVKILFEFFASEPFWRFDTNSKISDAMVINNDWTRTDDSNLLKKIL